MSWELLREVVEALDVSEYVDLYTEQFPRFAEAWDGLKWLLSRTPELKNSAVYKGDDGDTAYRAYALASDPLAGTPEIWVVYTFSDTQVIVIGLQARPAPAEDADGEPIEPVVG